MESKQADPQVMAEFQQRRTWQLIAVAPIVAAIIYWIFIGKDGAGPAELLGIPVSVGIPLCIAIVCAGLIFSFFIWRCPACKGYLGKAISPKFCHRCGVQLQG